MSPICSLLRANGCWRFHSVLQTSQPELSSTIPLPSFPIYPENPTSRLLCLPPAFTLVSSSAYFLALRMEEICSSETSVDFQRNTRSYMPEDSTIHNHRCENLKCSILSSAELLASGRSCCWQFGTGCLSFPVLKQMLGWFPTSSLLLNASYGTFPIYICQN
jgi:hypothetical protein